MYCVENAECLNVKSPGSVHKVTIGLWKLKRNGQ